MNHLWHSVGSWLRKQRCVPASMWFFGQVSAIGSLMDFWHVRKPPVQAGGTYCYEIGMGLKMLCPRSFWLFYLMELFLQRKMMKMGVKGLGILAFLNVSVPARGLTSCQFLCGLHYILFAPDQCFRSSVITAILWILGNLISVCRRQLAPFSRKCNKGAPISLFLRPGSTLLLSIGAFFLWKNKNLSNFGSS